ncbi:MAG TPA: polysaccharide biosynthesis tyrosine autokinase [Chthoniobacter sp.]|jgi:capsular exopolysaccharide synthesis family protein
MDSANPQAPSVPISAGLGIKVYRYRSLLRRHWWVMALTVGLGLCYEAYVLFSKPHLFKSESQLIIREELVSNSSKDVSWEDKWGNIFGTSVELLKSPMVLDKATSQLSLEAPTLSGKVDIKCSVAPRTNIFTIDGIGSNPEYTQRYVDAVVAEFFNVRRGNRDTQIDEIQGGLQDRLKQLNETRAKQEADFQAFIKTNNMAFWQEQAKSAAVFLSDLKNHQAQLLNEQQRIQNLTPDELLTTPAQAPVSMGKAPAGGGAAQPSANAAPANVSFNNELYIQYTQVTQQIAEKQAEVEQWKTVWKPKHPKMQALEQDLQRLQLLLGTIKKQNQEATGSRLDAIKAELKSLDTSIASWDKKVAEASNKDAEYNILQDAVKNTQAEIDHLNGNKNELDAKTSPDPLVVLHKATVAKPEPPGTVSHLLIGLIGGFVVGTIVLFLMDRADDRLASSTEMLDHFSEPILGQIPNVADSRKDTGLPLLQAEDDRYTYAEAFRSLRSSLIFMPNQLEMKTLLVTSAIPNEGKSTIASNLAITMAASGARVLLVDADLRRGDIAQLFDIDGRFGLSNILRGEVPWKEAVIQSTKHPTLSIIARGPVTNQSGELLLKPEMVKLLEEFKDAYDLTIFNTAPILAADDTPTLAPNFDGALMVVRASFTSARLTKNSLNMLYQRQVNVLGLILNCIDSEMPDYYYYRYPKYYAAQ